MNKEFIEQSNHNIALFMGASYEKWEDDHCEKPSDKWYYYFPDDFGGYEIDELKYHSSYDWLIPVIQKINQSEQGVGIIIATYVTVSKSENLQWKVIKTYQALTIENLYQAVVETIKLINNE